MNDEQIDIAFRKYLKISIPELKRLFPRDTPIFKRYVLVDQYPGSDHDGEIFNEEYQESHFDVGMICGWVLFNSEGYKWFKSLGEK